MSAIRIQPFHFTSSPPSTIPLAKEIFEAIFQNETVSLQRAFLACKNIDAASLFSETSKTHLLNLNPSSLNDLLEKHLVYLNLRKTVALFAKINSSLFPSLVLQSNQVNLLLENEMSLLIHSNSSILPDFIKMFSDSQLYFKLEPFFTDFATSKYSSISKQLMQDLDMNDKISSFRKYINTTNIEIDLITEKVDSGYLHASSKKLVLEILDSILIKTNSPSLVEFGFQALLDSNEIALLKQFIALLSRVDELDLVLKSLHKYISSNVEEFLKLDDMIEKILVFKRLIDRVALEAFSNSDSVLETVKKSFSSSINKQQNKPAELLARQMDKLLKQKVQSTSLLNEYLVLFRYISAKDVFEAFFQKDLAKRLLLSKSNLDNEMELVSLLKIECGGLFTSKLEGMFKDIEVSREISTNFKALNVSPFDFNVIVLSSAFWPTYPITSITLPRSVINVQNSFVEYYKGLYKGRRVTFQNSLETCIIRANFPLGAKELSVSVFQYLVLSCFNDIDTLTVEEIQSQTNISIKELSRTLSSLTSQKTRLLIEETNEKYSINKDFSHQLFRIKVTMGQTRTIEETITTNSRVYQDRKHILEALIVRIMKEKRRITHDELVGIVFERSLFGIKNSDVKERIETLIDREYIERGENGVYVYVA